MARAELRDSWTTDASMDVARQVLRVFLLQHRMSVVRDYGGTAVDVKQGSQFITRFLGGWFVNPRNFPKRAVIRFSPYGQLLKVDASIEETLGFGYLDPYFKSRYADYFQFWMNALKDALPPVP